MAKKLWIMVSGPYTSGAPTKEDRDNNLKAMNIAAVEIFKKGHVPVIGVNMALPIIDFAAPEMFDAIMMPLSLALAEKCDAVLRIGGKSVGADEELELIKANGGEIFFNLEDVPHVR